MFVHVNLKNIVLKCELQWMVLALAKSFHSRQSCQILPNFNIYYVYRNNRIKEVCC